MQNYSFGQAYCIYRADKAAQVTSDKFLTVETRTAVFTENNGLMTTIVARDEASSAANAFFLVENREYLAFPVKI